jgi:hypothetical protein
MAGLVPKPRGGKPDPNAAIMAMNEPLVREHVKLTRQPHRTTPTLDVQKTLRDPGDRATAKRTAGKTKARSGVFVAPVRSLFKRELRACQQSVESQR